MTSCTLIWLRLCSLEPGPKSQSLGPQTHGLEEYSPKGDLGSVPGDLGVRPECPGIGPRGLVLL